MDERNLQLAAAMLEDDPSAAFLSQAAINTARIRTKVRTLLASRSIPATEALAWSDDDVRAFMHDIAAMDSNNFEGHVGAGEREGRVFSGVVRERSFGLAHGVGRSGDITGVQPKAAGSSLVYKLCNRLALQAVRLCGLTRIAEALVLPTATGMTLTQVLLALKRVRPAGATRVLWSRIDQKSCFKCMLSAGCDPVVIPLRLVGDELQTDLDTMRQALDAAGGPDAVLAVMTTTSCFAPRAPDDVEAVARWCETTGLPHVINHAYGLQSSKLCHIVNEACRVGRVDAVVASTDKNFMVPVGGAILCVPAPSVLLLNRVSELYPAAPALPPS